MTPLILIGGFLGAGKTTLLKAVLPRLSARGVAPLVILNDYRNAYLDAMTLDGMAREIVPVSGSCFCCGSREDLTIALKTMSLPPSSAMLVEANGSSDMIELVDMLTADRAAARFSLPVAVTVVDVRRWQKRYWHNKLERLQVRPARYIVLSGKEGVDPCRLADVEEDVRRAAPAASFVTAEELVETVAALAAQAASLPARRFMPFRLVEPPAHHDHHALMHHFSSMEARLPARIARSALEGFLRSLPQEVLRAKGVAFFDGQPVEAFHFQRTDESDGVSFMKLGSPGGLQPVLILVGNDMPRERIATDLAALGADPCP